MHYIGVQLRAKVFYFIFSQAFALTRFAVVLVMMNQAKECEVVYFVVIVGMVKMSYLASLYVNIAAKTETDAAATA